MLALQGVRVPLLCLGANNDPVIHRSLLHLLDLGAAANNNIIVCNTEEGGHLGFLEGRSLVLIVFVH